MPTPCEGSLSPELDNNNEDHVAFPSSKLRVEEKKDERNEVCHDLKPRLKNKRRATDDSLPGTGRIEIRMKEDSAAGLETSLTHVLESTLTAARNQMPKPKPKP